MRVRKILVPTDFSSCSDHATLEAIDLAERLGADVTLMHAYGLPVYVSPEGGTFFPSPGTMLEITEGAHRALAALKRRLDRPDLAIDLKAEQGPAAQAIIRVAQEGGFDLVVMGTHGRTGLKHLLVGSVAEHVIRACDVPVLTLREHGLEPARVPKPETYDTEPAPLL
jgi:nucleotide-binding universal stress UspA family protein